MAADRLFDALSRQTATLEEITVAHAASQQSIADLNTLRQRDESAHAAETALLRQRISGMKMTLSWRLTAPFREMRRAARKLFRRSR